MVKLRKIKYIFIAIVLLFTLLSQLLSINRASADATVANGKYFFSGVSNSGNSSCDFAALNCDALLQYGVYYQGNTCVTDAANAGDFFGNGFNGGFSVSIKEL
jgi:hypothetical protein